MLFDQLVRARKQSFGADQWFSLPMTRHRDSFAHLVARQLTSAGFDDVPVMTIEA